MLKNLGNSYNLLASKNSSVNDCQIKMYGRCNQQGMEKKIKILIIEYNAL